ncbi:hypothetical protein LINPERHAP2_LOCUS33659, partial [Linum perenne]
MCLPITVRVQVSAEYSSCISTLLCREIFGMCSFGVQVALSMFADSAMLT